jgi:hypothetical protein
MTGVVVETCVECRSPGTTQCQVFRGTTNYDAGAVLDSPGLADRPDPRAYPWLLMSACPS